MNKPLPFLLKSVAIYSFRDESHVSFLGESSPLEAHMFNRSAYYMTPLPFPTTTSEPHVETVVKRLIPVLFKRTPRRNRLVFVWASPAQDCLFRPVISSALFSVARRFIKC